MPDKKGSQMAHPQPELEALTRKIESLIDNAAERLDDEDFAKVEKEANQVIEDARARASRPKRA